MRPVVFCIFLFFPFGLRAQEVRMENVCATENAQFNFWQFSGGEFTIGSSFGGLELVKGEPYDKAYLFTEGRFRFETLGIPFFVDFYYSELGFKGGRANRFSVQFDVTGYNRKRNLQLRNQGVFLEHRIDSLELVKEKIGQQIVFNKWKPNLSIPAYRPNIPALTDSISSFKLDTLHQLNVQSEKLDSLVELYGQLTQGIEKAKEEVQYIKNIRGTFQQMQTPKHKFFDRQQVKQLKLGNCAPSYSPLVLDGTRIQGMSITTESKALHFDLAGGWISQQQPGIMSPVGQNPISDWRRNILNRDGSIYYARLGYGSLNGSHIYVSGFRGKDELNSGFTDGSSERRSSNLELEGQWANQVQVLNIRAAQLLNERRSTISELGSSDETETGDISAFSMNHTYKFKKIALQTEVNGNWIGPRYYSIGSPFLRGDNASIGARIASNKVRWFQPALIGNYSYNDVRNLSPYGSTIRYAGLEIKSQPLSKLMLKGSYAPTLVVTTNEDGQTKIENAVYSATAMFNEARENINWTLTGNVARVVQLWDSLVIENTSYMASSSTLIHQKIMWEISWSSSFLKGLEDQDFHLTSLNTSIGYTSKTGIVVTIGGSILQDQKAMTYGYSGNLQIPITKNFRGQLSYEQFPVFESTDLIYTSSLSMPFLAQVRLTYNFTKN